MGTASKRLTISGILAVSAVALFIACCGAQPAAAATPQQRYTVFFDFNSIAVRPSAAQVIARAAATAKERQAQHSLSHVKVIGYADAAGSAAASQRLSEQRAAVVRDALTAQGVPAESIAVEGRGRRDPAVSTADRVREARNRRVRIVLYGPGE